MLSNAYFLAKFRFDTAENEPAKNLQKFCKIVQNFAQPAAALRDGGGVRSGRGQGGSGSLALRVHEGAEGSPLERAASVKIKWKIKCSRK